MKANAERIEKNTVLLEVEVEAEHFSKAMEQAYRKLVRKVNVPGFRRGKAPRVILERHIGKQALVNEAVEIVVPEAYFKAVDDTGIEPVAQPELELIQVEEGKPVVFKAKVVIKPEVELGQYAGIEVLKPDIKVSEEDVLRELERLQKRHAKLVTLEEGKVEKGDIVVVDYQGKIDGESFEGGSDTDCRFEVGSGVFFPGVEDEIVGMALGESKVIPVKFPEDYARKDLAGKEAVFSIKVKGINRKELVPLDDEFAKDISEFDTLEELKADLRNKLEQVAKKQVEGQIGESVLNQVIENAKVDVPEEMIDSRVEEMVKDTEQQLYMQGIPLEKYISYLGTSLDEMKNQFRSEAERNIKASLVIEAIAKKEDIEATEEEIESEIAEIALQTKQDVELVRKVLEAQAQLEAVKRKLQAGKVLQFLVDKAKIKEEETEEGALGYEHASANCSGTD